MIKNTFFSKESKDQIEVIYFEKPHRANLYIKCIDILEEYIKLVDEVVTYYKIQDIKWICLRFNDNDKPEFPENILFFEYDKTGGICCHIDDFKRFHIINLDKLLKPNDVYVDKNKTQNIVSDDGWITIGGFNSKNNVFNQKKDKLNELKNDIKILNK